MSDSSPALAIHFPRFLSWGLCFAWLAAGGFLLFAATWPPVSRTQEARVLETAREMAERPVAEWAIPRLNGAVRLRKPPLAYWLSAASFRVFGVSDFAGRLPSVGLAWVTLGTTFLIARHLFDTRAAAFAAAAMLSAWLGLKSALIAETDGPAAAFVTLGIYAALRAADATTNISAVARPRADGRWQHGLAACCAGAILAKGPPAIYLVLFVLGLCAVRRNWRPAVRFFTGGAAVTLLVLAVPWFAYVFLFAPEKGQLGTDLANSAEGGDHHGPPWTYVPLLLQATLPWTFIWLAALWTAAWQIRRRWQRRGRRAGEAGLVTLAVWGLAILLPLLAWGNKQLQYLLPVMPPTMTLVGWAIGGAIRRRPWAKVALIASGVTAAVLALVGAGAVVGLLFVRPTHDGRLTQTDATLLMILFGLAVWTVLRWRQGRTPGLRATMVLAAAVMFVPLAWLPAVTGGRGRKAADEVLRDYPDGHFYFRSTELPVMSWAMRQVVPLLSEDKLRAAAADPAAVVLEQQQDDEHEPAPPTGFVRDQTIEQRENVLHVFVPAGSQRTPASGSLSR